MKLSGGVALRKCRKCGCMKEALEAASHAFQNGFRLKVRVEHRQFIKNLIKGGEPADGGGRTHTLLPVLDFESDEDPLPEPILVDV